MAQVLGVAGDHDRCGGDRDRCGGPAAERTTVPTGDRSSGMGVLSSLVRRLTSHLRSAASACLLIIKKILLQKSGKFGYPEKSCNCPQLLTMWFCHANADKTANSVDPDQTAINAPEG